MRGLRRWQVRMIGWVAAYALALHATLMLLGPPPASLTLAFDAAAVLCHTSDQESGAPQTGDQPGGGQADHRHDGHCVLCASSAAAPPVQAMLPVPTQIVSQQPAAAPATPSFNRRVAGRPSLPRAPPPA